MGSTTPSSLSSDEIVGRARTRSIVLFCASMFFFWAALYVYMPILPVYATHLGASLTLVGLAVGVYGFSQLVARIPLGIWSDLLGKRKPFVVLGMVAGILGCLVMAIASDPWMLVIGRTVVGLAAATWVTSTVLFSSYFPPSQAVKAMGLASFFSGAPQVLIGPLGGRLAEELGWASPFYLGAVLAGLGLLGMLWVDEAPVRTTQSVSWQRFRAIGTVPLLIAVSCVGILNHFSAFATTYAFTPVYAEQLGASKTDLGIMMAVSMAAYSFATLVAFRLTNRFGDRWVVAGSMLVGAASIGITPLIGDLSVLIALQFLNGLTRGMIYPVLMGLSIRAVRSEDRATAVGIFQASYAIGMFAGPFVGGMIADAVGLNGMFLTTGLSSLGAAVVGVLWIRTPHPAGAQATGQLGAIGLTKS